MGRWVDDEHPLMKQVECYIPLPKNLALEGCVCRNWMYVVYPDGSVGWITHRHNIDRLGANGGKRVGKQEWDTWSSNRNAGDVIARTGTG
jgi:hypothetical protein